MNCRSFRRAVGVRRGALVHWRRRRQQPFEGLPNGVPIAREQAQLGSRTRPSPHAEKPHPTSEHPIGSRRLLAEVLYETFRKKAAAEPKDRQEKHKKPKA